MNEQMFDKWVQEALATDVTPSDDFTARVMARVAATPQELPRKNVADTRKLKRMMTALAACAAIVILIPMGMLMMPANEKAAADCAASESFLMDDAADMEYFTDERSNGAVDDVEEKIKEFSDASGAPTESVVTDSDGAVQGGTEAEAYQTMVHLVGDEAVQARAILAEMGCLCKMVEDIEEAYDLTAAETAALCQKLPGVIEVEGPLHLTLEVG
ncbi:MAG: hypothetical protein IKV99_03905 [Oscillospiraceae bacterium]|nr:hypothetical protein [Oscillospiraceae bacterium]